MKFEGESIITREEAIKRRDGGENCFNLLNEIYDYFEPIEQVAKQNVLNSFNGINCNNCKHLEYIEKSYKQCSELYINIGHISQDEFYCAYWERKE